MRRWLVVVASLLFVACAKDASRPADAGLFLPTAGSDAVMDALFTGPLVVRDGCVLAGTASNLILPIWQDGFTAARDDAGRVVVRDGDGATVAIEGEVFDMGGGFIAEFEPADRVEPRERQLRRVAELTGITIPERCLVDGVYGVWWVGDTDPIPG
jgi:hypothetical protein